jgi:hypothetical protein
MNNTKNLSEKKEKEERDIFFSIKEKELNYRKYFEEYCKNMLSKENITNKNKKKTFLEQCVKNKVDSLLKLEINKITINSESLLTKIKTMFSEYGYNNSIKILTKRLLDIAETKYKNSKSKQIKNEKEKMNQNKNYILNKLEDTKLEGTKLELTNYELLYRLINALFDKKLSNKSKTTFQKYWMNLIQEEDLLKIKEDNEKNIIVKQKIIDERVKIIKKKEDIMKILKSVYRLKINKSIKNKREKISKELNYKIENINKFGLEIADISSSMNLATSFHNFSKKTYYICNFKQLKNIYKFTNIDEVSEKQINELSPFYYVNGIFCINPIVRTYINNSPGLNEALKKEISENKSSNTGIELVKLNPNNNKNFIDIDPMIKDIEKYNKKNSLLSKFFDKYILGIANETGINNINKKNRESEINSKNFNRFCDEYGSFIDTVIVVNEKGKVTFIHTKTEKSDGKKILTQYFKDQLQEQKMNGGGNIQVGGMDPLSIFILTVVAVSLVWALVFGCNDPNNKNDISIIMIIDYSSCVVVSTFMSTMAFLLSMVSLFYLGFIWGGILTFIFLGIRFIISKITIINPDRFSINQKNFKKMNKIIDESNYIEGDYKNEFKKYMRETEEKNTRQKIKRSMNNSLKEVLGIIVYSRYKLFKKKIEENKKQKKNQIPNSLTTKLINNPINQ